MIIHNFTNLNDIITQPGINRKCIKEGLLDNMIDSGSYETSGVHIYSYLDLKKEFRSSDDTKKTTEYLSIIHKYSRMAKQCADTVDASILEIQGEIIHFFIEVDDFNSEVRQRVFTLSSFLAKQICDEWIGKEKVFKSFKMATDFGETILVWTGNNANDSLVSLAPAANDPAKQLRKTKSKHLRIKSKYLPDYKTTDSQWVDVDLFTFSDQYRDFVVPEIISRLHEGMLNIFETQLPDEEVHFFTNSDIEEGAYSEYLSFSSPIKIKAHYFKADLDGFTKRVYDVFASKSKDQKVELVNDFFKFISYADIYKGKIDRPAYKLPWAGDCANLVLCPNPNEKYKDAKEYLPIIAPETWHQSKNSLQDSVLKGSKWSISIAGGDESEGNGGYLLLADIKLSDNVYRIASGWSVGTAEDALDDNNIAGGDTVIHKSDHTSLDLCYKHFFQKHNGDKWWKSAKLATSQSSQDAIKYVHALSPVSLDTKKKKIPYPKPRPDGEFYE